MTQYMLDVYEVRVLQGRIVLLKSFHFLHVEVQLQADGDVQRDTRQLEKHISKGGNLKRAQPPHPKGCVIIPHLTIKEFQRNKHRKPTRDILIGVIAAGSSEVFFLQDAVIRGLNMSNARPLWIGTGPFMMKISCPLS